MEFLLAFLLIAVFSVLGSFFIRVSWWFIKAIIAFVGVLVILGLLILLF